MSSPQALHRNTLNRDSVQSEGSEIRNRSVFVSVCLLVCLCIYLSLCKAVGLISTLRVGTHSGSKPDIKQNQT